MLSIGIQTDLKLIVPNDYLDFHNTMRHQAKKQVGVTVVDTTGSIPSTVRYPNTATAESNASRRI